MYGRPKSPEFLAQQTMDKTGANNPMFGKPKSPETLDKIRKKVFVYDADTKKLIKIYPGTVMAKKDLKMGYDTLRTLCGNQRAYKGKIFAFTLLNFKK